MLNNYAKVAGRVMMDPKYNHTSYDEKFYMTYVCVHRLSGIADIIPVMLSENNLVKENDWILVVGEFRSYNEHMDGCSKLKLYVFCKCLTPCSENTYINEVVLDAYICKPVTFRTTPQGYKISEVHLGVNRAYGKTDYIPCITWWKTAGYVRNLPVGTRVEVAGRIQSRDYMKDGVIHQVYEVSAQHMTEVR